MGVVDQPEQPGCWRNKQSLQSNAFHDVFCRCRRKPLPRMRLLSSALTTKPTFSRPSSANRIRHYHFVDDVASRAPCIYPSDALTGGAEGCPPAQVLAASGLQQAPARLFGDHTARRSTGAATGHTTWPIVPPRASPPSFPACTQPAHLSASQSTVNWSSCAAGSVRCGQSPDAPAHDVERAADLSDPLMPPPDSHPAVLPALPAPALCQQHPHSFRPHVPHRSASAPAPAPSGMPTLSACTGPLTLPVIAGSSSLTAPTQPPAKQHSQRQPCALSPQLLHPLTTSPPTSTAVTLRNLRTA
jgi:hypothetical protein